MSRLCALLSCPRPVHHVRAKGSLQTLSTPWILPGIRRYLISRKSGACPAHCCVRLVQAPQREKSVCKKFGDPVADTSGCSACPRGSQQQTHCSWQAFSWDSAHLLVCSKPNLSIFNTCLLGKKLFFPGVLRKSV